MHVSTPRLVFTLGVLLAINTMNFFDRQILPAVQEKIKKDWDLSDSDLGWLGTAFIVLYAVVGLPLGRLADVWRRKWILSAGVALWSVLTFTSGLTWSFWSLFVMRLGVGVGEASCAPTASSLIGDLVPAHRRARALGIFMIGLPVGLALGNLIGGFIAQRYSWQAAFFLAAIPGLMLSVAGLFIADPVRGGAEKPTDYGPQATDESADAGRLSFSNVARLVLSLPTMWWIIASGALHNFNMYALGTFLASLLRRYHEVDVAKAGEVSGLIQGFGALGIFAGGWLGDRAFHHSVRGRLHVSWIGITLAIPCLLLAQAAPPGNLWQCTLWMLPAYMLLYFYYGTVYATIQDIIEPKLRGMAMAIYFFAMYTMGAVWGPVGTGWISDAFARHAAQADGSSVISDLHKALGLHNAMYVVPVLNVALVGVLYAASRTVQRDYERLQKRLEIAKSEHEP